MLTSAPHRAPRARRSPWRAASVAVLCGLAIAAVLLRSQGVAGAETVHAHAPHTATKPPLVTYGIGPATNGKPDSRSGLNFNISPGGVSQDEVVVVNDSAQPLTLNLYAADGVQSSSGKVEYEPRATPGTGARTWITLHTPGNSPTVRIGARSRLVVRVTIKVPTNATPGDHVAGIIVSLTARAVTTNGKNVNFDQGVGLSTMFHVSGALTPTLRVEHLTAAYSSTRNPFGSGSATVRFTVHNIGNVTLGGAQQVDVSGLFGASGPAHALADLPALLPGSSISETVQIPDVFPAFHLTAHVRLTPRPVVGEVVTGLVPVSADTGLWAVPWALLALLALVGLAFLAAVAWRRTHPAKQSRHATRRGGQRQGDLVAGKAL